jgi:gamma-glutamyl-gamma-aminobutyrate hydrolase PuuD
MSKNNPLILVVGGFGTSYYRPFQSIGKYTNDMSLLADPKANIKLAVFTGGEDVSPELYGETCLSGTYNNEFRDKREIAAFDKILAAGIPMFGICRGAQFFCAMTGGKLVQHVNGHHGRHSMQTYDGRTFEVNSIHHQMQVPPPSAKILAWAYPPRSNVYQPSHLKPEKEWECVYYPTIKGVGVQYHPEVMAEGSKGFQYTLELANKLISAPETI